MLPTVKSVYNPQWCCSNQKYFTLSLLTAVKALHKGISMFIVSGEARCVLNHSPTRFPCLPIWRTPLRGDRNPVPAEGETQTRQTSGRRCSCGTSRGEGEQRMIDHLSFSYVRFTSPRWQIGAAGTQTDFTFTFTSTSHARTRKTLSKTSKVCGCHWFSS